MKKWVLLTVLQLASQGADAYYTHRGINAGNFHEHDPLAAPFAHSAKTMDIGNVVGITATLTAERLLLKHGHSKIATVLAVGSIAGHAVGAGTTANGYKTTLPKEIQ